MVKGVQGHTKSHLCQPRVKPRAKPLIIKALALIYLQGMEDGLKMM